MAIITKCCCFDVRSGSYASGVYTISYASLGFIYFAVTVVNNAQSSDNNYFISSILGMIFCGLVFITAIFMMIGVYQDMKQLLIPFIIVKALIIFYQGVLVFLYIVQLVGNFFWFSLLFILLEIVIIVINIMCLLCVISQYQELKAGRSTSV